MQKRIQAAWARDTLVVLHGPLTRAAAVDIESKLTEAALRNVWTADFRHFAHGRHHWLAKRGMTSAVLAFTTATDQSLANATLKHIPEGIPVVREHIPFTGALSGIAALARVMYIAGSGGAAVGIDPGRPGVPAFGSRIYRLKAFRSNPKVQNREDIAICRKTGLTLERLSATGLLDEWRRAYLRFVTNLSTNAFRGVVLDYDGTLCGELDRHRPLSQRIVDQLDRLLRAGVIIGVATGRGKSVRQRLQESLVREHWPRVVVGYYNGGRCSITGR